MFFHVIALYSPAILGATFAKLLVSNKTALVLGATGLVGTLLTDQLLQSPEYDRVAVLVRRTLDRRHPKLIQEITDFDQLNPNKVRGDDVFCCLGTTIKVAGSREAFYRVDGTYPYEIGRLARQNGAAQYLLVTAMGADPKSPLFYNRVKGETEQRIDSLGFPTFCIFRPSLLLGDRREFRLGERVAQGFLAIIAPLMLGGLKKYRPVEARQVAAAMRIVASRGLKGRHVFESDQLKAYEK